MNVHSFTHKWHEMQFSVVIYELKLKYKGNVDIHWKTLKYPTKPPPLDIIKCYGLMTIFDYCKYAIHPVLAHLFYKKATCWVEEQITIELEKTYFLGIIIFKDLTEYCFHPQRLLRLCNIYNIEMNDYMDII